MSADEKLKGRRLAVQGKRDHRLGSQRSGIGESGVWFACKIRGAD